MNAGVDARGRKQTKQAATLRERYDISGKLQGSRGPLTSELRLECFECDIILTAHDFFYVCSQI